MVVSRMTLDQIKARKLKSDRARIDATTDADIDRQIASDEDTAPDITELGAPVSRSLPALSQERIRAIRARTRLSQRAFAGALRIPVATYQNWEQGRTAPDPVARTLLYLLERDPQHILKLLAEAAA